MRSLILAAALCLAMSSTAAAQCANGQCARGGLRSVLLRPVRIAAAPVRVVRERQVVRRTVRVAFGERRVRRLATAPLRLVFRRCR